MNTEKKIDCQQLAREHYRQLFDSSNCPYQPLNLYLKGLANDVCGILLGQAEGRIQTGKRQLADSCLKILAELERSQVEARSLSLACLDVLSEGGSYGLTSEGAALADD